LSKVFKRFGDYSVVDYGIRCLVRGNFRPWHYEIPKCSLLSMDWIEHMRAKNWVKINDFINAYNYAVNKFYKGVK
jgi:hypothetical protein